MGFGDVLGKTTQDISGFYINGKGKRQEGAMHEVRKRGWYSRLTQRS